MSVAALAACLLAAAARADPPETLPPPRASFTADSVVEIGGDRLVLKIFHDRGRERQEMLIDGLRQVTILRPDRDKAFVLQSGVEELIELPLAEVALTPLTGQPPLTGQTPLVGQDADYDIVVEGREREGGEETTKFDFSGADRGGRRFNVALWVTDDGIIMRMEGEIEFEGTMEGVLMLRRSVERGKLDAGLFEPTERDSSGDPTAPETVPPVSKEMDGGFPQDPGAPERSRARPAMPSPKVP